MYRILVRNRTNRCVSLSGTGTIPGGMGRVVASTENILLADRLVAVVGVAVVLDFPPEERGEVVVTATEFGCELDHPVHGRISVTIVDPQALESGLSVPHSSTAPAARDH